MKKKIIIGLLVAIAVLGGAYAYLSFSAPKYQLEKEETTETKTKGTHSEESKIAESIEESPVNIKNLANEEELNKLIPELEDLSNTNYSYTYRVDEETSVKKNSVDLIFEDKTYVKVTPTENSELFRKEDSVSQKEITDAFMVLSKKNNVFVSGIINDYFGEYSTENITEFFSYLKEKDQETLPNHSYYRYYDFGEVKEFKYKNFKGVYNECVSGISESAAQYTHPFMKTYNIAINMNGKMFRILIQTLKNTSFGQMTPQELLDYMIKIEEA